MRLDNFRITASDGKTYDAKHYNLSAIIAVGDKVNAERAVQFRKWATQKGFAMDDERLARGGFVLNDRYFEEQLQRVGTREPASAVRSEASRRPARLPRTLMTTSAA